jgi:hypothetical protein
MKQGYIGNSKWHFRHFKEREFLIGYFYRGQMEKGNIVTLYPHATLTNDAYFTDDGRAIPKKVYRALVEASENLKRDR